MKGLAFINPNNNKNVKGFLFIDIIVGVTLFFIGTYCLLAIALRSSFLLQTLIKRYSEHNKQLALVRLCALHIPLESCCLEKFIRGAKHNYIVETKQVVCMMSDHTKLIVNVVGIKKHLTDVQGYLCYVMQSE